MIKYKVAGSFGVVCYTLHTRHIDTATSYPAAGAAGGHRESRVSVRIRVWLAGCFFMVSSISAPTSGSSLWWRA